jgi:hypothetical protein
MTLAGRACALVVLLSAIGCGSTYPERTASTRAAAAHHQPNWLASAAPPAPAAAIESAAALPPPAPLDAQDPPRIDVPRVEEERSPANYPVAAEPVPLVPAVTPVSAVSPVGAGGPVSPIGPAPVIAEPDWKPAGRRTP